MKIGDVVRIEIDGIGELYNAVVEEPDGYVAPASALEDDVAWVS